MIYAGIGARATPLGVLHSMYIIAQHLGKRGVMLRSGRAEGADTWFEAGAKSVNGPRDIFDEKMAKDRPWWMSHARKFHPNWPACSFKARQLHSRNSAIICGASLSNNVDFVICWTPGAEVVGGTGQGLRIAQHYRIPVFNLARDGDIARLWERIA